MSGIRSQTLSYLLVPESEAFPDLDAYVAERYPDGRPYALGGPYHRLDLRRPEKRLVRHHHRRQKTHREEDHRSKRLPRHNTRHPLDTSRQFPHPPQFPLEKLYPSTPTNLSSPGSPHPDQKLISTQKAALKLRQLCFLFFFLHLNSLRANQKKFTSKLP